MPYARGILYFHHGLLALVTDFSGFTSPEDSFLGRRMEKDYNVLYAPDMFMFTPLGNDARHFFKPRLENIGKTG
jgi:hypothetical protein